MNSDHQAGESDELILMNLESHSNAPDWNLEGWQKKALNRAWRIIPLFILLCLIAFLTFGLWGESWLGLEHWGHASVSP